MNDQEEITVKEILEHLNDLATAKKFLDGETGESISFEELQQLVFNQTDQLAHLLGIELEESSHE